MSLPNIFISGDSWGTGELPNLVHLGLEQYFCNDGYQVYNSSTRGSSNRDSISLLLENLKQYYQPNDLIFWIQTDPIRNLNPTSSDTKLNEHLTEAGGLIKLMTKLLAVDYDRLHSIARRFDSRVFLIGGLNSVDLELVDSRPRLECLLQSWPRLLVGNNPKYQSLNWDQFRLYTGGWTVRELKLEKLNNIDLAGKIIDELYEMDCNEVVFRDQIFHPDGRHPNRNGHKMLYNYIKERLKL